MFGQFQDRVLTCEDAAQGLVFNVPKGDREPSHLVGTPFAATFEPPLGTQLLPG
jgi:hypothetical protein